MGSHTRNVPCGVTCPEQSPEHMTGDRFGDHSTSLILFFHRRGIQSEVFNPKQSPKHSLWGDMPGTVAGTLDTWPFR